jgi:hypothetical protein
MKSKLKVDIEPHRRIGMTILSEADVAPRKVAMKGLLAKTKVCEQCHRRLPLSCFSVYDEAKKANPGIERFCAVCWSCP